MKHFFSILFIFSSLSGFSQAGSKQIVESKQLFSDIKEICDEDDGNLWGKNIWSPILIIDRESRLVVANRPDKDGLLKKNDGVFIGKFPENMTIANSVVKYGDIFWTMVAYPLPDSSYTRKRVLMHEMFHRLQPELNLDSINYSNGHIDKEQAKIYLKLEWEALIQAIQENNETVRKEHLNNALHFRVYRRSLFPSGISSENAFEIHEGMPEYTAHRLVSKSDSAFIKHILDQKSFYWNSENQHRVFGYFSGLLYACLLDLNEKNWRDKINVDSNIGRIAAQSYNIPYPESNFETVKTIRDNYNYKKINIYEHRLHLENVKKNNEYIKKFTGDSLIILPIIEANFGFSPSAMFKIDSLGTVFKYARIVDNWGILRVDSGGCLYSKSQISLPADKFINENNTLKSKNWELTLNKGWMLIWKSTHYIVSKQN